MNAIERAAVSVDVVCFALAGESLTLLLVQRADPPFAGSWALPGGAVLVGESLHAAATRLLAERSGVRDAYLEQLYTFGDPDRDPRGRTLSVAYVGLLPASPPPTASSGRGVQVSRPAPVRPGRGVHDAAWFAVDDLPGLAFDHARIAAYARQRLSQKLTYTPLAFHVLPPTFTLGDLRTLHEAVDDRQYDPSNFQKQMLARWDLAPISGEKDRRTRRPARLYRYIGPRRIAGPPEDDRPATPPDGKEQPTPTPTPTPTPPSARREDQP
jgi:ADP-ribose pyrophosphatase YjhB (NUDIX family)